MRLSVGLSFRIKKQERNIGRKEKWDMNKLCYVCSPYRGNTERNVAYARELTRIALDNGYAPVTPHLYLTQIIDESDAEQ